MPSGALIKIGDTDGTISATLTVDLDGGSAPQGSAISMFAFVHTTVAASTPSWVVTLRKRIGGVTITIGATIAIVATGISVVVLDAAFDGKEANTPNHAVLLPDQIVFTRTTGNLAAEVYLAIA